ncbi:MAG: hypothetical protein ACJASQ_004242 [Crocinitomicaceae bacterium]|jgi:hypothetical protein
MKNKLYHLLLSIVATSLIYSCESNPKEDEVGAIVSEVSNRFDCNLKSEVTNRSDSSFITIFADCESLELHEYGKILVEVYEELDAHSIQFDHYLVKSIDHQRQLGFVAEVFPALIKKRAGFYKATKLLEKGEFKSFVDFMDVSIKSQADSVITELFQNHYHLTGRIEFVGFEIAKINSKDIGFSKPTFQSIIFIGKTVKNEQVSISMNTAKDDNKIYGVYF